MPTGYHPVVYQVLKEHSTLFKQDLGHITITDTGDSHPIKVHTRPIPFIMESMPTTSYRPWPKEASLGLAVAHSRACSHRQWCDLYSADFVQLNKVTKKDTYVPTRTDGPQQKLANYHVFSKILKVPTGSFL